MAWDRSVRAAAKRILPAGVVDSLRNLRKLLRRASFFYSSRVTAGQVVTEGMILDALRQLGVRPGDDLLVHSSMRGLGVIENGAAAAVSALQRAIAPGGTLLAPAYTISGTMLERLTAGGIALDVRSTPSQMGKISETIRRLDGAERSLHPTHSVAAAGPRAAWYVEGHEHSPTPCGNPSPFFRLIERRGWIVALGSPIGKITSYHVLEDLVEFPYEIYLPRDFPARMVDRTGREIQVAVKCHDPELAATRIDANREKERQFEELLTARGVLRCVEVGRGRIWAMRADTLHTELERLLREGITIYGVDGTPNRRRAASALSESR